MLEKILEVIKLSKSYQNLRAVDEVSFSVASQEIVGLLGPNGAGKTTTLNMILGLLTPTSGAIKVFGKNFWENRSEILAKTNFAAVYAHLPGNLSVYQNLLIFAMLYGVKNPKERINELLEEFDLARFAKIRAGFLSSGEQSRLTLAKSFLNEPKLLLLDEPTASIDPSASEILRSKIKEYVAQSRAGALWTSHDMKEIEAVCSRVLFISHGKILLEGNPRELPAQYGKRDLDELFIAVAREPLSLGQW